MLDDLVVLLVNQMFFWDLIGIADGFASQSISIA